MAGGYGPSELEALAARRVRIAASVELAVDEISPGPNARRVRIAAGILAARAGRAAGVVLAGDAISLGPDARRGHIAAGIFCFEGRQVQIAAGVSGISPLDRAWPR